MCGCCRVQSRDEIVRECVARYDRNEMSKREYNYYPVKWREPYLARRRACGWGLYGTLGIGREDKDKMHAQHARNYTFFDAPVGLIFSIDRDLEQGSWLDYGMFLQAIMVGARQFGLETCPQAAWLSFHDICSAASASRPSRPSCAAWRSATRTRSEGQRVHA